MNYKLIETKSFGDETGRLISFEKGSNCPFEVKRAFYIFDAASDKIRGQHANRNSEFLMTTISGSCKVKIDDGKTQKIIELDSPYKALYLDKMIWKDMYDFSSDAVLLILANTMYDENEYIRDYDEYINEIRGAYAS